MLFDERKNTHKRCKYVTLERLPLDICITEVTTSEVMFVKSMDDPATLLEVDGHHKFLICWDTVDGSEIRRSPVDMVNIPLFTGFYMLYTSQVVVWDFFHDHPTVSNHYSFNIRALVKLKFTSTVKHWAAQGHRIHVCPSDPSDPGSPKLRMVEIWNLNTMRFGGDERDPKVII